MSVLPQRQVHLDFHTSGVIEGIGSKFNKEQFKSCLKKGHVNSITIFAKCHHGWMYFPSETGNMHPHLSFDLLSEMLEACKEADVAAPIYISAGFDEQYVTDHPDHTVLGSREARYPVCLERNGVKYLNEDARYHLICMNSPYLDLLTAQVKEIVGKFNPCGIFLDIVAPRLCYCKYCRAEARRLGLDEESDRDMRKLGDITYKKYYDAMNSSATSVKPDVRIFHNGGHIPCGNRSIAHANTHLELESLPTGGWGYDHFPKSARYVANLGMDYLGMTGKFHLSWGEFGGFKHPNALRYEVALSLANGAKCSIGDQMHPYGFLDDATYELIGTAYAEAEQVEEYCYDGEAVADIGIISSEAITGRKNCPEEIGACRMMLEGKYLYDVLDLECDFSKYKLLILPDTVTVAGDLENKLRDFIAGGGKLLCTGISGTDGKGSFVFDLGVDFGGKSEYSPSYYRPGYNALGLSPSSYVIYSDMNLTAAREGAEILGYSRETFFNRTSEHFCSHRHTPFVDKDNSPATVIGRDGGYIAWNVFSEYAEKGSYIHKDTVMRVLDKLLGESKTLVTDLPSAGVVTLSDQKDKSRLVLHTLYASPIKRGSGVEIIEDIVPLYNVKVRVRTDREPVRVKAVPQNTSVAFTYENGVCSFSVEEINCSQITVIEYK